MQYLQSIGLTELSFAGVGLIMSDVAIEFKGEGFYGDVITAQVAAGDFTRIGFDLYYQLTKQTEGKEVPVAYAKTGMVCFDYQNRKVAPVPEEARKLMM
jgi:acyl-CoA thioester hydrolase